jgi:glycosyltransferase involved in cell wall biosynthesis
MKVLLAHNYYQSPGGEDQVVSAESTVLRAHGDEVLVYTSHNDAIPSMGKIHLAASTVWNPRALRELGEVLRTERPDIVHFHNTFPLMSPAVYSAARRLGIPVVQTLHNFRLLCVNGLFLRNGRICEDCLGKSIPWPGVVHACYRASHQASAVTAAMLGFHRARRTWTRAVNTYIAVSEFARSKFIAGGLPPDRIVVKPNFLPEDPGVGDHAGGYALYVGRLSAEKGVEFLVRLWKECTPGIPLWIIGNGPLETLARDSPASIRWLGWQPRERVLAAMKDARFLVFPTSCYEGLPMVLLEAMATGLPTIATELGSVPEVLQHGSTGMLAAAGATPQWREALQWAESNPDTLAQMGRRARREFEAKYTPEVGYLLLSRVYQQTLARGDSRRRLEQPAEPS